MSGGVLSAAQFDALAKVMRLRLCSANSKALRRCLVDGNSAYIASVAERANLPYLMESLESVCALLERVQVLAPSAVQALAHIRGDVGQVIEQADAMPLNSAETHY